MSRTANVGTWLLQRNGWHAWVDTSSIKFSLPNHQTSSQHYSTNNALEYHSIHKKFHLIQNVIVYDEISNIKYKIRSKFNKRSNHDDKIMI